MRHVNRVALLAVALLQFASLALAQQPPAVPAQAPRRHGPLLRGAGKPPSRGSRSIEAHFR